MDIINKYFLHLTDTQKQQFEALGPLYKDWNAKINVVSRKDIDNIYEHHVLHSLGIAKFIRFKDSTSILDIGTGGGFPGIPLAILFPNAKFKLIDGTGKKIMVATEIAKSIGLKNVTICQERAEEEKGKFDYIVSRAVMTTDTLIRLVRKNISSKQINPLPNGLICLKGGALDDEINEFRSRTTIVDLSDFYDEEFFVTKKVVYVSLL